MNNEKLKNTALVLVLCGAVLFLWARAYQHFFFEGPYRAFFLDQPLFGGIQKRVSNQSWLEFVNSQVTERNILFYTRSVGFLFILTSLLFLAHRRVASGWLWLTAGLSSLSLLFYGVSDYLDKGYQLAQWIEYASQIALPLLFVGLLQAHRYHTWILFAKIAVALTFLGHGLYAVGFFPVPGHFIYMTTEILNISDSGAKDLLLVAGVLDLIAVVLLFFPKTEMYAVFYCLFWGFLTALARPLAYIEPGPVFWLTVHQTLFEFFVRIAHFLIPLYLFLGLLAKEKVARQAGRLVLK